MELHTTITCHPYGWRAHTHIKPELVASGSSLLIRQNGALQSSDTFKIKNEKNHTYTKTTPTNRASLKMAARDPHHDLQLMLHMQTHPCSALLAFQLHNHAIPLLSSKAPAASFPITCFFLNQRKLPCSKQKANGTDQIVFFNSFF